MIDLAISNASWGISEVWSLAVHSVVALLESSSLSGGQRRVAGGRLRRRGQLESTGVSHYSLYFRDVREGELN